MSIHKDLSLRDIFLARRRIGSYIEPSPLEASESLSRRCQAEVYLKYENLQKTGSFKVRGALNKLLSLSAEERQAGVITASAGNHGLGVAYAAKLLQIPGKIVVPEQASPAKIAALQNFDLELIQYGEDYDDSEAHARKLQKEHGLIFIHAFSDPAIIAGQGTVGFEIVEALPEVDTLVVPVGGGGLICGIGLVGKTVNPAMKIIGVQSEASPAMYKALLANKVVETPIAETIADGLAGRFVTDLTLSMTQDYADDLVLVSERTIREAVKALFECEHLVVEGSAAVGIAALLEAKLGSVGKCVIVLTGRNIDLSLLSTILET